MCMKIPFFESVSSMDRQTTEMAQKGEIDDVLHMKTDKVYVFAGTADTQIKPSKIETNFV